MQQHFSPLWRFAVAAAPAFAVLAALLPPPAHAQLFDNLRAFDQRSKAGDPGVSAAFGIEGPKGVTTADFDGDGHADVAVANLDGTVTILPGQGDGTFGEPLHLATGGQGLRQIVTADFDGDKLPDLAAAAPFEGKVHLFLNRGESWEPGAPLLAGSGARNLAAGDFDGDGINDLAVAGPGLGLLHYRGLGQGSFVLVQDLPQLGPFRYDFPKPVFGLLAIPASEGTQADLLVTHAESSRTWLLSSADPVEPLGSASLPPGEQKLPLDAAGAQILITEIMALNRSTLAAEDGQFYDWIELHNRSGEPVSLEGWGLTDDREGEARWLFPDLTIEPGAFLVVFASGLDRNSPGSPLHTSFRLSQEGEYLALLDPTGSKAHGFDPGFPEQLPDISYGLSRAGVAQFFDLPTPGRSNQAGEEEVLSLSGVRIALVDFSYAPGGEEPHALRINVDRPEVLQRVWFSFNLQGLELSRLMMREQDESFTLDLSADFFTRALPYRFYGEDVSGRIVNLTAAPVIEPGEYPVLRVVAAIPTESVHSLDAGPLTLPAGSGLPDLVSANRDLGTLTVHRGVSHADRFSHLPYQTLTVPGGPRSVRIVDLDADGWNDLVVVLRNYDRVLTYRNEEGILTPMGELPSGVSPREIAIADFNEDGYPDGAVINRISSDVSVLTAFPGHAGFGKLEQIYATDGEVVGLQLRDFNGDGRDDVLQVHRQARDYSLRYSQPDGSLSPPVHFDLGDLPSAESIFDVNGDGRIDVLAVNLAHPGSVSVRLALPGGGFAPEERFVLTGDRAGGLFALVPGDFDGDGKTDLAAGYFDCRIAFFRGSGDGSFTHVRTELFTYESRAMVTGDFDQDGDIDLAGVGYAGDIVVIENRGDLFTAPQLTRRDYPPPSSAKFGATQLLTSDIDGDGDPDLIMGSGEGIVIYYGAAGMAFEAELEAFPEAQFSVSGMAQGDFDGNGELDLVVTCRVLSCLMLFTKTADGEYGHALSVDVPSAALIAAGDLDGDGLADLAGAGDVLWTALSSRRTRVGPSTRELSQRQTGSGPVINEILAVNNQISLDSDYGKKPDWVEIYQGGDEPLFLEGWTLEFLPVAGQSLTYRFPEDSVVPGPGYQVVVFSTQTRSPWHTGFRLPGEGGTLRLLDPDGGEADRVNYPSQQENVSYARYADGLPSFVANSIPTPGGPNTDNGPVEPEIEFLGFDLPTLAAGRSIVARARATDDIGLMSLCLLYRRVDVADPEVYRTVLFDDGMHDDGDRLDGIFTGALEGGLPAGAEIRFVLEGVDLSGRVVVEPGGGGFDGDDGLNNTFSLAIGAGPALQLSEVVADNRTGLRDESGGTPDYVEIRNAGVEPVSLDGVSLARSRHPDTEDIFTFPKGLVLAPGEHIVIYADNNIGQGALHAPFRIDRSSDFLLLTASAAQGGVIYLDEVNTPALGLDQALFRLGDGWRLGKPSPFAANLSQPLLEYDPGDGGLRFLFPTRNGTRHTVQFSRSLEPGSWEDLQSVSGTGIEATLRPPFERAGFLRVREMPQEAP
ncbi:MAG TPA: FG-GAP-like repeat-containing protein [Verrucomicrobiales bacterium]|nr:FG-GAP-like repeat-containing protein [Verrucomicrobiales bacterium]